ncbi:MAG: alpha/beta fold hydrolase [Caldilineaceae bacterium]|nr:alpha/beta fold hydrolase [Caldilineaceae bacterium]
MRLRRLMWITVATMLATVMLAACTLPVTLPIAPPVTDTTDTESVPAPAVDVDATAVTLPGDWDGRISILGQELRIIVHFSEDGDALTGTIDIPQQGAVGIPLENIAFDAPAIHFEMLPAPSTAVFDGTVQADGSLAGSFSQSGYEGTFSLARIAAEPAAATEDLPYRVEDVTFANGDVTLAGTLTLPEGDGPFPSVLLVSGSGPQNRDEEIAIVPGYRPFAVIADTLTRQDVAVLRYDDRGVGESTGDFATAALSDFAADAEAGWAYLTQRDEIDAAQVGIFGHSEGGQVAAVVAGRNPDVAFVVLMAGPGERGDKVLNDQIRLLMKAGGATDEEIAKTLELQELGYAAVRTDTGWDEVEAGLRKESEDSLSALTAAQKAQLGDIEARIDAIVAQKLAALKTDWFRQFIDYDPAVDLASVDVPVLALYGGRDMQVPAESNAAALAAALAHNPNVTVQIFPTANHLFQDANSGMPDEYALLAPEFLPGFLDTISEWLITVVQTR